MTSFQGQFENVSSATASAGVSVIIPCLNEVHHVGAVIRLLQTARLHANTATQIIVVDGGSDDGTLAYLQGLGDAITLLRSKPGRAVQMNAGAGRADYDTLYFVHADTRPPVTCLRDVAEAVESGHDIGGYAFSFDSPSRLLRFNSYLTGFNVLATRGGDQSIFIRRSLFWQHGGYDPRWVIMEEYDLMRRIKAAGSDYCLLKGRTLVSDRKYRGRTWARVQIANIAAMALWRSGAKPEAIRRRYVALLGPGEQSLR